MASKTIRSNQFIMTNHKEVNKHQEQILSAKYPQLGKYAELSDIELAVVAGGEGPRHTCSNVVCHRLSAAPQNPKSHT